MKTLIRYFSFLLFALIMVFSPAHAANMGTNVASPAFAPVQRGNFPFGQTQKYSVVFRGNGEAVITLNAALSNTTDQPLSELKFRVPKGIPSDIIAYQVIGQRQCIEYDYSKQKLSPLSSVRPEQPPCLQYQEPDFNQYIQGYNVKYQKATTDLQTDTIILTLPQPIPANNAGGIMLYFRNTGYAKKDIFGGFNYSFETLKIEDKIQTLQVGISTDSDLLLKDTDSSVSYRFADTSDMMKAETSAGMAAPMANAQFDSFYHQIGQGSIIKTSSNLQPLDSYVVTGRYAKTSLQLYAKEIAIGISVVIIFLLIIVFLIRWGLHAWTKKGSSKNASTHIHPVVIALISSFGSALTVVIYTIILMFLFRVLTRYMSSDIEGLMMALLLVVSFGVYGFILFAAPVLIGMKRGLVWGAATLGFCIGWIILFILFILVFFFITHGSISSPDYPMMMRANSGISVPVPDMMEKAVE